MNSKLIFKFHTAQGDEVRTEADNPELAAQRLKDFLDDAPEAHRYVAAILIATEIPQHERCRDGWQAPTMTQVIRAWYNDWQLLDIAKYGSDGAWPHFTRQQEAALFYDRFEDEVFAVLDRMAERSGVRDVLQVLEKHANLEVHSAEEWKNAAVWVAVEQVVRGLVDDLERAAGEPDDEVEAEAVSV